MGIPSSQRLPGASPDNGRIAFYCGTLGKRAFDDWLPVAHQVRARGFEPVFLIEGTNEGLLIETSPDLRVFDLQTSSFEGSFVGRWLPRLSEFCRYRLPSLFRLCRVGQTMLRIRHQLLSIRPGVLITFCDGFLIELNAVVHAAKSLDIPSVVSPLSFFQPPMGFQTSHPRRSNFRRDYELNTGWKRLLAQLFPRLAPEAYGTQYLSISPRDIFVATLLGIVPPVPHCRAGGDAVLALAPTELDRECWEEEGVAASKVAVTGSAVFDRVSRMKEHAISNRHELCARLDLDPAARLVVVNFAALAEHGFLSEEEHQQNLRAILSSIRRNSEAQIVISVHPGPFPEYFHRIAAEWGARATQEVDVVELIALCDFYISAPSTTVCLALGAGKPVVILYFLDTCRSPDYDEYMRDFLDQEGALLAWDKTQMTGFIERLVKEPGFLAQLTASAANGALTRQFDGACAERMAERVIEVCRRRIN